MLHTKIENANDYINTSICACEKYKCCDYNNYINKVTHVI